jgi:hypothetical protein
MAASVKIRRKMTRKDGKAKATIKSSLKVSTSPEKVSLKASKKIVPNV